MHADLGTDMGTGITKMSGWRSFLAVPLRQQGNSLWNDRPSPRCAHSLRRRSSSLKPSPMQAVIAIENVRLFQELTEALEQQTATSEILGSLPARRLTFSRY